MKKLLLGIVAAAAISFIPAVDGISKEEREKATKFLLEAQDGVMASVKGLSEEQLKFKPAADKWSVEDCIKHIAVTETALWQMTEGNIKGDPNPDKRSEIKWTDEEVMKNIEDRTNKVKTFPAMEPQNTSYKTMDEALTSFTENRKKLIEYVNTTEEDLRNHVTTMPFASFDCYQMILFIGAHSIRHTKQIEEIKADANFPKK